MGSRSGLGTFYCMISYMQLIKNMLKFIGILTREPVEHCSSLKIWVNKPHLIQSLGWIHTMLSIVSMYSQCLCALWKCRDETDLHTSYFIVSPVRTITQGWRAHFCASTSLAQFQQKQQLKELWWPRHLLVPTAAAASLSCVIFCTRNKRRANEGPFPANRRKLESPKKCPIHLIISRFP